MGTNTTSTMVAGTRYAVPKGGPQRRPTNYDTFTHGQFTFRWWTRTPLADPCDPGNIVVDEWAFRTCPDGVPRLRPTDVQVRAHVALLIATDQRAELDRMRDEEMRHEAMVDAYESALIGMDTYESELEGGEA